MSTRNSRKKTRINVSATLMTCIDDRGSQSNNDFDSISPESCHYLTREQAYSGNEIAHERNLLSKLPREAVSSASCSRVRRALVLNRGFAIDKFNARSSKKTTQSRSQCCVINMGGGAAAPSAAPPPPRPVRPC